jgi:hypothetical protein
MGNYMAMGFTTLTNPLVISRFVISSVLMACGSARLA